MANGRDIKTGTARDRNQTLWLLIPIWALLVGASVYAIVQIDASLLTVADIGYGILQGAMIVIGVIILANRPRNLVGRLILTAGISFAAAWMLFLASYLPLQQGDVSRAGIVEAISNSAATLWVPLLAAALIYFPDATLPSGRWRWIAPVLWVTGVLAILAPLTNGGWGGDEATAIRTNPLREMLLPLGEILAAAFGWALGVVLITATVTVVVRFKRSEGVARQQMKWLAYAALLLVVWFPIEVLLSGGVASTGLTAAVGALVFTLSLIAIGVAVLRYRLYEIDRIISRTVTYTLVVAVVIAIFFGTVTLLTSLLPSDSQLAVAGSTLATAALFNPLRRRVQASIDRTFNRSRYHHQQVVDRFTRELRDQIDIDALASRLSSLVQETLHPVGLGIWISKRG